MSIKQSAKNDPLMPPPVPPWGKIEPEGKTTEVVRFVLADRTVSFRLSEVKRWEHVAGNPETLVLKAGKEAVTIEGKELVTIREALDKARLVEVRINANRPSLQPGPVVRAITIEPA